MARLTYNLNTLQDLYKRCFNTSRNGGINDNNERDADIDINQLRRNVIRTNNSRKLSYCVPSYGTLNRHP